VVFADAAVYARRRKALGRADAARYDCIFHDDPSLFKIHFNIAGRGRTAGFSQIVVYCSWVLDSSQKALQALGVADYK
jgi:hypothetical protein